MKTLEGSKKHRLIRRILENSEVYKEGDLRKLPLQELLIMQKRLLITLRIKQRFKTRRTNSIIINGVINCN